MEELSYLITEYEPTLFEKIWWDLCRSFNRVELSDWFYRVVIIACAAGFLLLLAYKWGIIKFMQVKCGKLISKLANCQFCLSFWFGLLVSLLPYIITGDYTYLVCPICTTPLTRLMS